MHEEDGEGWGGGARRMQGLARRRRGHGGYPCQMLMPSETRRAIRAFELLSPVLRFPLQPNFQAPRTSAPLQTSDPRPSPAPGPTLERLLSLCPRLHRLNLAANQLANDGCVALARCLPYCPQLQALDVRGNGVGDVGLSALAGVLPLVPSLQVGGRWRVCVRGRPGVIRRCFAAAQHAGGGGLRGSSREGVQFARWVGCGGVAAACAVEGWGNTA